MLCDVQTLMHKCKAGISFCIRAIHRVHSSRNGSHYCIHFVVSCTHVNVLIFKSVCKSTHVYARLRAWCCLLHGRGNVLIAVDRVRHCIMDSKHKQNMCLWFDCITSATRMLSTSKCCATCRRRHINAKRAFPSYSGGNKHGAMLVSLITLWILLYFELHTCKHSDIAECQQEHWCICKTSSIMLLVARPR